MCNGNIAFTTDIRRTYFGKFLEKEYQTNHCWGYSPVSTYAQRSLITRIRDNFSAFTVLDPYGPTHIILPGAIKISNGN